VRRHVDFYFADGD